MEKYNLIAMKKNNGAEFCTMIAETEEEKIMLYNITTAETEKVSNHIGEVISLKHIYMQSVEIDAEDGEEPTQAIRTILIDENGVGYASMSNGIVRSVQQILNIFGSPATWEEPKKCRIMQLQIGKNRTFRLEMC